MAHSITKADLITEISEPIGISRARARTALDDAAAPFSAQFVHRNAVVISGLAKLVAHDRPTLLVRNIATSGMFQMGAVRKVKYIESAIIKAEGNR